MPCRWTHCLTAFLVALGGSLATGQEWRAISVSADPVGAVTPFPDGPLVATGSFDQKVRLWNPAQAAPLRTMPGHTSLVLSLAASPDGRLLASGANDNTVRLWEIGRDTPTWKHQADAGSTVVALTADGTQFVTAGQDRAVRLWNLADRALVREWKDLPAPLTHLALKPDRQHIAAADATGNVHLFHRDNPAKLLTIGAHAGPLVHLAYAPNDSVLLTATPEGEVKRWPSPVGTPARQLAGHEGPILAVALIPQQDHVATAAADKTIAVWNLAQGALVRKFESPGGPAGLISFSNDGGQIATAAEDRIPRLLDLNTGAVRKEFPQQPAPITAVVFHPSASQLVVASGDVIRSYKTDDATLLREMTGHTGGNVRAVWTPGGEQLVSIGGDKTLRVWKGDDGAQERLVPLPATPTHLAVSQNRQFIAVACDDRQVRLLKFDTGEVLRSWPIAAERVTGLDIARDEKRIVIATADNRATVYDLQTGQHLEQATAAAPLRGVTFHHNSQGIVHVGDDKLVTHTPLSLQGVHRVAEGLTALHVPNNSGQYVGGSADGQVRMLQLYEGRVERAFVGSSGAVRCVTVSPNEQLVAAGSGQLLTVWNNGNTQPIFRVPLPADPVRLQFSADQKRLLVACSDHLVRTFDPTPPNGQVMPIPSLEPGQTLAGHTAGITSTALSADGKLALTAGADGVVFGWEVAAVGSTPMANTHNGPVYGLAFHPQQPWLFSASGDKTVKVWDLKDNYKNVRTWPAQNAPVYALALTPDGKQLVTAGGDGSVRVFPSDADAQLRQHTGPSQAVYTVAMHPQGQQFAAAGLDRTIWVWGIDQPQPQRTLRGHADDIYRLAYNRAGTRLLSVGYAGNVCVWDPQQDRPLFQSKVPDIAFAGTFTADGRSVVIATQGGKLYLTDLPAAAQ